MNARLAAALEPYELARDPSEVAAALARLRCSPSPAFRSFYQRFRGAFGSEHWGFMLLDLIEQDVNVITQTQDCREVHGFPDRFLVMSDLVGGAVLVYDCVTDAVFNMDFEGSDEELLAGKLEPDWPSFERFLEAYFLAETER